jgi:hypothetical protein
MASKPLPLFLQLDWGIRRSQQRKSGSPGGRFLVFSFVLHAKTVLACFGMSEPNLNIVSGSF